MFLSKAKMQLQQNFFDSVITLRFGKTKEAKEEFYGVKKPIKIWDADANDITISKLVETKNKSNYLIGYLDEWICLDT